MRKLKQDLIEKKKKNLYVSFLKDNDINDIRKSLNIIKHSPQGLINLLNIDNDVIDIILEDLKFILEL
jgi:hypothetical protein